MFNSARLERLIQQSIESSQPPPPPPPVATTSPPPATDGTGSRGGRGGRGRANNNNNNNNSNRGGRGGPRPASARSTNDDTVSVNSDASNGTTTSSRGGNRGRGRGGRGGNRGGAANGSPTDASSPTNGDPSATASSSSSPPDSARQAAADRAAVKAKAKAKQEAVREAKLKAEAWLNDPTNSVNVPSQPLTTELTQIARRYNKSFTQSQVRSSITCSFSFDPSDPDFAFTLPPEKLRLQFTFHDISLYPYAVLPERTPKTEQQIEKLKSRVQVEVLNEEKDVPRFMRQTIEQNILTFIHTTQYGKPQMLRSLLKQLDKDLLDWLILSQKKHDAIVARTIAKLTGADQKHESEMKTDNQITVSVSSSPSVAAPTSSPIAAATSLPAPTVSATAVSSSSPPPPPPSSSLTLIEPEDEWSTSQQDALEFGLKNVPRTLPAKERWDAIAAGVEGKTRKQVLDRYKYIRDKLKTEEAGGEVAMAASSSSLPPPAPIAFSASSIIAMPSVLSAHGRELDPDEVTSVHAARVRAQQIEREMDALRLAEQQEEDERNGIKRKKPKKKKPAAEVESKEDGSDSDESNDSEGFDAVPAFQPTVERVSLNPAHRGTQIIAHDVQLKGIGILKSHLIRAQLLCVRCESRIDIEFTPANGVHNSAQERCARCGIEVSLVYLPSMVHEHSDSLGYLDLINGELFDLLPSDFFGTCLECFTEHPIKQLTRAQKYESNCRNDSCHSKLAVQIPDFEFVRITAAKIDYDNEGKKDTRGSKAAAAQDPRAIAAAKNQLKEQKLLKLGTPLPNKGACKHYGKSYRWMRFPCCGQAFPCDICHNDAVTDGHEAGWATRMICGNCSKEQAFSNKPCVYCGLAFSTTAKQFWEGGNGMRDQTRLSRNDSKKHSGAGKTQSMKASRVGQKAASAKPAKQAPKGNNES